MLERLLRRQYCLSKSLFFKSKMLACTQKYLEKLCLEPIFFAQQKSCFESKMFEQKPSSESKTVEQKFSLESKTFEQKSYFETKFFQQKSCFENQKVSFCFVSIPKLLIVIQNSWTKFLLQEQKSSFEMFKKKKKSRLYIYMLRFYPRYMLAGPRTKLPRYIYFGSSVRGLEFCTYLFVHPKISPGSLGPRSSTLIPSGHWTI